MATNNENEVAIARIEERVKQLEVQMAGIDRRLWGAVGLILVYVANKVLALINMGGL